MPRLDTVVLLLLLFAACLGFNVWYYSEGGGCVPGEISPQKGPENSSHDVKLQGLSPQISRDLPRPSHADNSQITASLRIDTTLASGSSPAPRSLPTLTGATANDFSVPADSAHQNCEDAIPIRSESGAINSGENFGSKGILTRGGESSDGEAASSGTLASPTFSAPGLPFDKVSAGTLLPTCKLNFSPSTEDSGGAIAAEGCAERGYCPVSGIGNAGQPAPCVPENRSSALSSERGPAPRARRDIVALDPLSHLGHHKASEAPFAPRPATEPESKTPLSPLAQRSPSETQYPGTASAITKVLEAGPLVAIEAADEPRPIPGNAPTTLWLANSETGSLAVAVDPIAPKSHTLPGLKHIRPLPRLDPSLIDSHRRFLTQNFASVGKVMPFYPSSRSE